jgi:Tfp pilus assembly pilus retraction ATPase PilT
VSDVPVIDEYLKEVLSKKARTCISSPAIRRASACMAICSRCARPPRADFVQQTLYEIMPKTAVEALRGARRRRLRLQHGRVRPLPRERHAPLNGMGAVMRAIPSKALTLEQLNLPPPSTSCAARTTGSSSSPARPARASRRRSPR